ncbi:hypothetical protein LCGC14_2169310 [marine sediment metagenome]|uniref:Uncharacterized protein n=1 Tax=marine sediment metagenome TaxID=412755 RepID=A0A0F9DQD5_9ZZZZ
MESKKSINQHNQQLLFQTRLYLKVSEIGTWFYLKGQDKEAHIVNKLARKILKHTD